MFYRYQTRKYIWPFSGVREPGNEVLINWSEILGPDQSADSQTAIFLKTLQQAACGNTLLVSRKLVEDKLLAGIKTQLFTPEAINLFKQQTTRLLREARAQQQPDMAGLRVKRGKLDTQIENLVAAIADGYSPALKKQLDKAEQEKAKLVTRLNVDTRELDKIADFLPAAPDHYKKLVNDLETTTQRDIARVRVQIKRLLHRDIRFVPSEGKDDLIAELAGDCSGLLSQ